jgi:hypothetical protein
MGRSARNGSNQSVYCGENTLLDSRKTTTVPEATASGSRSRRIPRSTTAVMPHASTTSERWFACDASRCRARCVRGRCRYASVDPQVGRRAPWNPTQCHQPVGLTTIHGTLSTAAALVAPRSIRRTSSRSPRLHSTATMATRQRPGATLANAPTAKLAPASVGCLLLSATRATTVVHTGMRSQLWNPYSTNEGAATNRMTLAPSSRKAMAVIAAAPARSAALAKKNVRAERPTNDVSHMTSPTTAGYSRGRSR